MNIRVGDIVRFLSEKLEGKVTGFIDNSTVNVYCDEYGFEIPGSISDLVVIRSDKAVSAVEQTSTRNISVEPTNSLYLVIEPDNFNNLPESRFTLHLLNDTSLMCLYTVILDHGKGTEGLAAGNCDAGASIELNTYRLREIDTLKEITVHAIFFQKGLFTLREPVNATIKISASVLCKAGSYHHTHQFTPMVFLRSLSKDAVANHDKQEEGCTPENPIKTLRSKGDLTPTPAAQEKGQEEKPMAKNIIEIDLHADELLETTAGMNNSDILEYQLDVFHKTMDKYKLRKGQKIVFIHGKGDGVLRQRILWELQTKYKRCRHQDASFKQYGFGATMVTI